MTTKTKFTENPKRRRYELEVYGSPFVPAEETRVHLKYLMEVREIQAQRIAAETGVPLTRLRDVRAIRTCRGVRGYQQRVRREDARAILSYDPSYAEIPDRHGRVRGAQRVLQGLSAKGVPSRVVAEHSGFARRCLDNWRMGTYYRVPSTESYIRLIKVAQHLEGRTPESLGVDQKALNHILSRSKRSGWAPIGMWDWETIHEAEATPDWTGACGTMQGWQIHYRTKIPQCEPCREAKRRAMKREQ
jgi:hypothetical protein